MKRTKKHFEPREETRKKMQPITRDRFTAVLRKAAKTQAKAFSKKGLSTGLRETLIMAGGSGDKTRG
jgi:hypothetical protein